MSDVAGGTDLFPSGLFFRATLKSWKEPGYEPRRSKCLFHHTLILSGSNSLKSIQADRCVCVSLSNCALMKPKQLSTALTFSCIHAHPDDVGSTNE